ncbi:trefoil factor 2 [Chelydra serpentina]|uniref:Trefoil factor 2 n=1 Tax=Chelydra serpentina TaxID=8475 RepID=A0A8T1S621_CHESE|nr:trefoil factor 2 [Chelydra serpentina]
MCYGRKRKKELWFFRHFSNRMRN